VHYLHLVDLLLVKLQVTATAVLNVHVHLVVAANKTKDYKAHKAYRANKVLFSNMPYQPYSPYKPSFNL